MNSDQKENLFICLFTAIPRSKYFFQIKNYSVLKLSAGFARAAFVE